MFEYGEKNRKKNHLLEKTAAQSQSESIDNFCTKSTHCNDSIRTEFIGSLLHDPSGPSGVVNVSPQEIIRVDVHLSNFSGFELQ